MLDVLKLVSLTRARFRLYADANLTQPMALILAIAAWSSRTWIKSNQISSKALWWFLQAKLQRKKRRCDDSRKAYSLRETTCNQLLPGGILHLQESLGFLYLKVLASEYVSRNSLFSILAWNEQPDDDANFTMSFWMHHTKPFVIPKSFKDIIT
jgi:hypothetical protein